MYYPKSQIQTNLHTNGDEYQVRGKISPYVGYYYKTSNGKFFTGRNPNGMGGVPLYPIALPFPDKEEEEDEENTMVLVTFGMGEIPDPDHPFSQDSSEIDYGVISSYLDLFSSIPKARLLPIPSQPQPTLEDKAMGEYRRYFAKKNNELIYLEISKETYTKFKSDDPNVASDLYNCLFLPWSLNSETTNRNIVALVEKDNKWYGFSSYFKDYFGSPRN